MKRALLVLTLGVLGACTTGQLESGRYACERDVPDQCPGAWRCGLEGFCHQQGDTTVAWRCAVSDDCEGGFVCGVARSREFRECHDPAAPQDWPCEQPGDCTGAWLCGLSTSAEFRQCHDPAAPKAWPCESGADCVGGWGCGLASSRERRECHDPQNPRAWACADDADCLSWRCGTDGVCVDPSGDALGLLSLADVDGGARINPLGSTAPVTMLSVSPLYETGRGRGRSNLAFVQDGHMRAMSLDALMGNVTAYDLGTMLPTALIAHGARGAPDTAFEVPDELERVSMTWPDGGLTTLTFADGGLHHRAEDRYIFPMDMLAHGSALGNLTPSVLGVSASPGVFYARLRGDYFLGSLLNTERGWTHFRDVPNNRIRSMAALRHAEELECVYLVDDRGLWVSQRGVDAYHFEPVSFDAFSHVSCGPGRGPRITSVASVSDRWLAVTSEVPGGPVQVAMLDAIRTWVDRASEADIEVYCSTLSYAACDPSDRVPVDVEFGPCVACPGEDFLGMSTIASPAGGAPALEVLCGTRGAAGATFRLERGASSSNCTRTLITSESSFFVEPSPMASVPAPGVVAWSGASGQVWFGSRSADIASLAFDRAATGMVRRGTGRDDIIALAPRLSGTPSPTLGLASTRGSTLTASVAHAPTFALSGAQLIDLSGAATTAEARTLGFTTTVALGSPTSAALTQSPERRRIAVVSAGSIVYAGDLEPVLSSSGPAVALSQRLTTVEPITSLAFPKEHAPGTAPFLSGYAVVGTNVVRVVADTLTRWRTEAVALPATLVPRTTWFQGTKGRVGFMDGSVFSLPSRVRIMPPLPRNDAVDFAQVCGQQLALAPDGLFRMEPNGADPIGRWQQVPLPAEVQALDFSEGRVHGLGNEAFVFTRTGEAARVTFASCPE